MTHLHAALVDHKTAVLEIKYKLQKTCWRVYMYTCTVWHKSMYRVGICFLIASCISPTPPRQVQMQGPIALTGWWMEAGVTGF